MLVVTLLLAAIGFGLLVIALMTGSVVWAWLCIAACIVGAVVLLSSVLLSRGAPGDREPSAMRPRDEGDSPS